MDRIQQLEAALREAREYFDARADAEYTTESASPRPNEEMQLRATIDSALAGGAETPPDGGTFGPWGRLTGEVYRLLENARGKNATAEQLLRHLHERICQLRYEINGEQWPEHRVVPSPPTFATTMKPTKGRHTAEDLAFLREKGFTETADEIERLHAVEDAAIRIRERIATRLNDHLCEMKPGYDDSITGFNEAWDIVRKTFDEGIPPQAPATTDDPVRKALEFYADASRYDNDIEIDRGDGTTDVSCSVLEDGGKLARAALNSGGANAG